MDPKITTIKNFLVNEIKNSPYCDEWFYQDHLLVVEKLAMDLCDKHPKANRGAVTLMVWFHDIGRAHGHDEDHDLYGAELARSILAEHGLTQDLIDLVADACTTHSCDDHGKPETLEGKILATADALSHFHQGFFLRIFGSWSRKSDSAMDYQQLRAQLFAKIERDMQDKLFFEEARSAAKPIYEAWQTIISQINI